MTDKRKYWNEKMETLSADEFRQIQSNALIRELDYVWKHSVFYQEKFTRAGIEPGRLKSIDDLGLLPFTEKHELRESLAAPNRWAVTRPRIFPTSSASIPPAGPPERQPTSA